MNWRWPWNETTYHGWIHQVETIRTDCKFAIDCIDWGTWRRFLSPIRGGLIGFKSQIYGFKRVKLLNSWPCSNCWRGNDVQHFFFFLISYQREGRGKLLLSSRSNSSAGFLCWLAEFQTSCERSLKSPRRALPISRVTIPAGFAKHWLNPHRLNWIERTGCNMSTFVISANARNKTMEEPPNPSCSNLPWNQSIDLDFKILNWL